jgi:hypothetical protein
LTVHMHTAASDGTALKLGTALTILIRWRAGDVRDDVGSQ